MRYFLYSILVFSLASNSLASWYWPFGSDSEPVESNEKVRISELMEPATIMIDEASDLAAEQKFTEAIAKYKEALLELDRIENEHPDRAATPEFATLRNKRAYVNAAIESMTMHLSRVNARPVAVSDTAELERRLNEERNGKSATEVKDKAPKQAEEKAKIAPKPEIKEAPIAKPQQTAKPTRPLTKREQAIQNIANGDYAEAEKLIEEMLDKKPNNAMALNLKAAMEVKQGKLKEAEATLDQAIRSNPKDYHAYYNLARLMLQSGNEGKDAARRYYETGRAFGGSVDRWLEEAIK